jgi:AraC-like DNA-binding protein
VIRIEDVAAEVNLSISTLNRHFRAATSMSPLQYQKQIRLQRARVQLLANPVDVAGAGHAVGYASASQFTREYRRLFGVPPGRDAIRLLSAHLAPEWQLLREPRSPRGGTSRYMRICRYET